MKPEELVRISDENYAETTRIICEQVCPGGASRRFGGIIATSTGTDVEWLNIAFVTGGPTVSNDDIRQAAAFYRERGEPWVLRVRADVADAGAGASVEACSLRYTDDVPGLVLAPLPPPAEGAPVEIQAVQDARDCASGAALIAAAFGRPPAVMTHLFSPRLIGAVYVHAYVGRADGAIVATSILIPVGGVAGIWGVATLDAYRRRGIGEAMTRHAIDEGARLGCTSACLQASEMGQPVYERMGFRTVAQYRTYVPPEVWEKMHA